MHTTTRTSSPDVDVATVRRLNEQMVLHALNEGRVARLVVDIERHRQGRVFLDGRLAAAGERLPGIPDKAATTDHHSPNA